MLCTRFCNSKGMVENLYIEIGEVQTLNGYLINYFKELGFKKKTLGVTMI